MPKLGDIKLNVVYSEELDKKVTTTDHPIEDGLVITDHVLKEPVKLKITGVITGGDGSARLKKLGEYMAKGKRLTYVGRYLLKDALIESMPTTKDVDVSGAEFKFDITLKQAMIVKAQTITKKKPIQKPPSSGGKKQPIKKGPSKKTYVVVKGDNLTKIAQKFYGSKKGYLYTLIYNANKKIIGSNPNNIKPGQKLIIP